MSSTRLIATFGCWLKDSLGLYDDDNENEDENNVKPSFDDLTFKVRRYVGDVQPAIVVFCDELGEADLALQLHLLYETEQPLVVGPIPCNDIGCTAEQVVAVLSTAHELIQLPAAVA